MPKKTFLALLAALSCFSAPARAGADFTMPVTADFWEDDFTWKTNGKAYVFRWTVIAVEGRLAVCGAGQYLNPTTRSNTVNMMRKAMIIVDGKTILTDMSFFTKIKKRENLLAAKATCRDTGVPEPREQYKILMDWPSTRARF